MDRFLLNWRRATVFCTDLCMIIAAWLISFALCTNLQPLPAIAFHFLPFLVFTQGVGFYLCGLYRGMWRFASISDLVCISKSVLFGIVSVFVLIHLRTDANLFPLPISLTYGVLLAVFLSGPRFFFRWLRDYRNLFDKGQRVLIVGAGSAGEGIVRDLLRMKQGYKPVAFVDDNISIIGREIHGVRVKGTCQDIPSLTQSLKIQLILIAMPSASSANMRRIVNFCEQTEVPFRTLPGLKELAEGRVNISSLREVSLEDLLGREQVYLSWEKIHASVMNKIVLVTGGGSIGTELCMQLAALAPARLIIVENGEFNLYSIEMKLRKRFPNLDLRGELCSVADRQGIEKIFSLHQPELVFHSAAYKHVPLLESQLRVAMFNNIVGTRVIAETAATYGTKTFVLISTDKAVNPTNIMGATKRASEVFCQNLNFHSATHFITVRFGNVLESAGSVVPLFREQLQAGGPLTVTHAEMTRFFMTIPEASQLIMQAASIGEGGEIFVLDMGEPIKISYLAEQLIRLSGKVLGDDVEIHYTGLRPGEKLHEELFYAEEELNPTVHPKIRQAKAQRRDWFQLVELLNEVEKACEQRDEQKLFALLRELVPEYRLTRATAVPPIEHLQLVYSQ